MKKAALIAVSIITVMLLAACGKAESTVPAATQEPTIHTDSDGTQYETVYSGTAEGLDLPTPTPEPTIIYDENFYEKTLANNDDCTVKLLAVGHDTNGGYYWKLSYKNKSQVELNASIDAAYLNGIPADPNWHIFTKPGETVEEVASWDSAGLRLYGLKPEDVTKVDIYLSSYINDFDSDYPDPLNEYLTIYPTDDFEAQNFVHELQPTDMVLYNTDTFTMAICGFDPNNIFGYTAKIFLVNKLDEPITFGAEKGSIDGEEYDPMWGEKVDANSIVYSDLHWYEFKDACKASGKDVNDIKEIVMPVTIDKFYGGDILAKGTCTIYPQENCVETVDAEQ